MRGLKILIIAMAVLIAVGLVLLVIGVVEKSESLERSGAAFAPVSLKLPPKTEVIEMDFSEGRIFLRTREPSGANVIVVLSAETGKEIGRININPEK
tara:strand:- start:1201 stop:1491 length:291 start_codon:yes stop_codon:yes gene_type:complete